MRVLALTRYERLGASSRVRFYQYVPFLKEFDIDVEVSPLVGDDYLRRLYSRRPAHWTQITNYCLARLSKLLSLKSFDLLWIEKELLPSFPPWLEELISMVGIRYVVDYDDAVFHNYDLSGHPVKRLFANKIDCVMRNATLVVCGNRYLAERARAAGARCVQIVPTVVDIERYNAIALQARQHIVVGWIGSPTTVKYLEVVAPALKALSADLTVHLRVIGAHFSMAGVAVDCHPWSEDSEVNDVQDFDIGIMPLIDGPWERGKCGYKLIQYMACGKPVIASPVGVNQEIVEQGVNGYLAHNSDEWLTALQGLCIDATLRSKMGMEGRIAVERRYCIQVTSPRLAQLFRQAAGGAVA